jgi:hypothetical protein
MNFFSLYVWKVYVHMIHSFLFNQEVKLGEYYRLETSLGFLSAFYYWSKKMIGPHAHA